MKKALIRLEDIGPGDYYESAENQAKLIAVADFLRASGVPFHVAVIPRFVDPIRRIDRSIADRSDPVSVRFVQTLHTLSDKGASLGIHGYTHQYGKTVSGEGYEFHYADCRANCPPDDSPKALSQPDQLRHSYAYGRFAKALELFHAAGLRADWFETPHYAASPVQRDILEACSGLIYENNPAFPDSRKITFRSSDSPVSSGALYVPTPLFYVSGEAAKEDTERIVSEMRKYGADDLASFFYHPFLEFPYIRLQPGAPPIYEDKTPLKTLIRSFQADGRRFVSILGLLSFVPDFRQTDLWEGPDYRVLTAKTEKGGKDRLMIRQRSSGNWYFAEVSLDSRFKIGNGIRTVRPVLSGWPVSGGGTELAGDFNGDGRTDTAVWHPGLCVCEVALHTGTGLQPDGRWLAAGDAFRGWQALAGDLNGDGLTDLVLWDPDSGRLAVALSHGRGFYAPQLRLQVPGFAKARSPYIADVNGDGLADLVLWDRAAGQWDVWLSDGLRLHAAGAWLTAPISGERYDALLADLNGDGRSDLLLVDREQGLWTAALSTGSAFLPPASPFGPWAAGASMEPLAGDFHGTGRNDLLARWPDRFGGTLSAAVNILNRR